MFLPFPLQFFLQNLIFPNIKYCDIQSEALTKGTSTCYLWCVSSLGQNCEPKGSYESKSLLISHAYTGDFCGYFKRNLAVISNRPCKPPAILWRFLDDLNLRVGM